jgi:hypothetical protein
MGLLQHVAQLPAADMGSLRRRAHSGRHDLRRAHGSQPGSVLKYANSGDVTGDHSRVVGYSADVFVKAAGGKAMETPFSLSEPEKSELLALARKSVEYMVQENVAYEPAGKRNEALNQERGAFTTLKEGGRLAGLHRLHLGGEASLHDGARHGHAGRDARSALSPVAAGAAATRLRNLRAVAAAPRRRRSADQGGRARLADEERRQRRAAAAAGSGGTEMGPADFLEQTCAKAGMQPGCWKDENTDIFMFTAVVFGEHKS